VLKDILIIAAFMNPAIKTVVSYVVRTGAVDLDPAGLEAKLKAGNNRWERYADKRHRSGLADSGQGENRRQSYSKKA
jgi:hypothetical protein